jgi:hypothetical protein
MDPDPVRLLLASLLEERGLTHAEASRAIGHNHAYIHQFMKQGKPAHLPETVREALGRLLEVDPNRLRHPDDVRKNNREAAQLDPRLIGRTMTAVDAILPMSLVSGLPANEAIRENAFAAIYALLEREAEGHKITDDNFTLRVIGELVRRLIRE